jgi:Ca2+-binding EF-hand superfamily protein
VCCSDLSTLFNIYVLFHHWTNPPHPKFVLRAPRKLSIRMHVLSGTVEIAGWCLAWFWGVDGSMDMRDTFTKIQVIASFVHCATAAYQTPIVFGTQAVMVPVYVCCICVKLWCGVDLWINPQCAMKSARLYNILSIYTWCRVMVGLFQFMQMFEGSLYSIAILLAGAANLPSLGAAAPIGALLITSGYCLYVYFFCSPQVKAQRFTEHGRDIFDGKAFGQMLSAVNQCPFAALGEMEHKDKLRALFDSFDRDHSGTVSREELQQMAEIHGGASWLDGLQAFQALEGGEKDLTFDDFCRVLATRSALNDGSPAMEEALKAGASFDTQAHFLFDKIRQGIADDHPTGADGTISAQDVAFLLSQYGMPPGEARNAMRKYDISKDGTLSFEEFKAGFKPLVKFQIHQLRGRVSEIARAEKRVELAKQHSEVKLSEENGVKVLQGFNANDVEDAVDDTLDAVGGVVGGALNSARERVEKVGDKIESILPGSPVGEFQVDLQPAPEPEPEP